MVMVEELGPRLADGAVARHGHGIAVFSRCAEGQSESGPHYRHPREDLSEDSSPQILAPQQAEPAMNRALRLAGRTSGSGPLSASGCHSLRVWPELTRS